jgi:ubiquinone/menaquinone biosynthesis C-methylase UbiE
MIGRLTRFVSNIIAPAERPAAIAYDAWSSFYDRQPDNLMLHLDGLLFSQLLRNISLENKMVVDIGCGTGRHWPAVYAAGPSALKGFDVSQGMLQQLQKKFPGADVQLLHDNTLAQLPAASVDCLISTLTIAHIENLAPAIAEWSNLIKPGGDIVITDFHPAMLAQGGKRSFTYQGKTWSVKNFVHPVETIIEQFRRQGVELVQKLERSVDESVRIFYEQQNALHVYNRFSGMPLIYGLHLTMQNAAD